MDLIVSLFVLFLVAKVIGEGFRRIGQAPLIGEVLAGVLLGPSVLAAIDPSPATATGAGLEVVAALGILFLVLAAGLDVGREGLRTALREGTAIVAAVEFAFPFLLGYGLGHALGLGTLPSLFLAVGMAVTALPVSVRILMDLRLLATRLGRAIVSVAVVNDVLAFALLAVLLGLHAGSGGTPIEIAIVVGNVLAFVALVAAIGWVLRQIEARNLRAPPGLARAGGPFGAPRTAFTFVFLLALGMGAAAEVLGLHFAIGVFYAGIFLTREAVGPASSALVRNTTTSVGLGVFAPLFFAYVGLRVSLAATDWFLVAVVTGVAFLGKVLGGVIGGRMAGFRGRWLAALGIGLNARGMMELILAEVGFAAGLIGADLYTAIVVMTLATTLSTPVVLKSLLKGAADGHPGRLA